MVGSTRNLDIILNITCRDVLEILTDTGGTGDCGRFDNSDFPLDDIEVVGSTPNEGEE